MPEFKYLEFDENAAKAEKNAAKIKDVSNTNSPVLESLGETMFLSMGPSHPSMHGVLRFMTELDGETIVKITPDIGYLHRGDEKIAENVVSGYKKIEDGVVNGFTKMTDGFVERFLTKDGESVEEAKRYCSLASQ